MTPRTLLFRADAGVATGTGHIMRCLSLAQAWRDAGGQAVFVCAESTAAIEEGLHSESCEVVALGTVPGSPDDAEKTIALAQRHAADWVAVDGYHFKGEYQRALKAAGLRVLFFDDYGHADEYPADLVLNQNLRADTSIYEKRGTRTRLLLGPRYAILRREFAAWRKWQRKIRPVARQVLVTMGGSDPENVTSRTLEALALLEIPDLKATVIVGGSNPNFDSIRRAAGSGGNVQVLRDVSNIAELMSGADVAISAAGSTCWELSLLALPALLIDVAENQTAVARELDKQGYAIHLGNSREVHAKKIADNLKQLLDSEEQRKSLSQKSRQLVDGGGAQRVLSILKGAALRLRPARRDDSRLLWEWVNDPQVRASAFSIAPISWERHEIWFASKMKDPNCSILIAENERGVSIGQFRVDWRSSQFEDGEIDVSVAKEFRGTGFGAALIDRGAEEALLKRRSGRLHAFVKVENQPSRAAFELAGFENLGEENLVEEESGRRAIHYVRSIKY